MQDAIVLFRYEYDPPLGNFYEAFEEDADKVGAVLRIATSMIGNTWMVGFSVEFLQAYLGKLIAAGHRVALCDRESDNEHERFLLRNANVAQPKEPMFIPLPKGRQKPLLRGLQDSPGQKNLFPGMEFA
jgi:DNA mismatch repair ATPase MutS